MRLGRRAEYELDWPGGPQLADLEMLLHKAVAAEDIQIAVDIAAVEQILYLKSLWTLWTREGKM